MGRFLLRMPANKNTPEHWQEISTNLSGPPDIGQLKLKTYQGWARHVPQGTVGDELLKLRHRKGDGWHNVLYMTEAGVIGQPAETWFILGPGIRRIDGYLTVGPGTQNGYTLSRYLANPNRSRPTPDELNFLYVNQNVAGPNYPNAFWTPMTEAVINENGDLETTQYLADANRGLIGRNQGFNATTASGTSRVWRVTEAFPIADGRASHELYPQDGSTVLTTYNVSHVYVDLAFILRHTAVEDIAAIRVNFSGNLRVGTTITDNQGMNGIDMTRPPPFRMFIDDITSQDLNVREFDDPDANYPVNPGPESYRRSYLPAQVTDHVAEFMTPKLRYRDTFDTFGSPVFTFQASQYGFTGEQFEYTYDVPFLGTDHLMFKVYTESVSGVTPPPLPAGRDPSTWRSPELLVSGVVDLVTVTLHLRG